MDSYDNDWLFLDDDLFVVWFDDDITMPQATKRCDRFIPLTDGEDDPDAVATV